MTDWNRDMDAAPKDGTCFLVTWFDGIWPPEALEMMLFTSSGKLFNVNSGNYCGPNPPTHWRPLLAPPEVSDNG